MALYSWPGFSFRAVVDGRRAAGRALRRWPAAFTSALRTEALRLARQRLPAKRLHATIPGCSLQIVEGAGHMVHHVATDRVVEVILAVVGGAGDPIASEAPRQTPDGHRRCERSPQTSGTPLLETTVARNRLPRLAGRARRGLLGSPRPD
jgi:hypothetical protein